MIQKMAEALMKLKVIPNKLTVCKVADMSQIEWNDDYLFIGKTDEELSVVCSTDKTPLNTIEREDGWRAFRVEGQLDFSLIGILSSISTILAENGIGIFAVSTYNTDYILTKEEDFDRALSVLKSKGHEIN